MSSANLSEATFTTVCAISEVFRIDHPSNLISYLLYKLFHQPLEMIAIIYDRF